MNRGLLFKSFRELWPLTLLFGAALLVAEGILSYVLPTLEKQLSAQIMQLPFVQNIVRAMLGTDISGGVGLQMFIAIPWVHPVVLALTWAHAIVCCTRIPAGEVDRGTIDVLLGLPVSRWQVMVCDTLAWLGSAVVILVLALVGNMIGSLNVRPESRPEVARLLIVLLNLLCLYLAVGGMAWLCSACSDRRGRAIAIVFAIVLASFLLNYLAQFWPPAERIIFLSVLNYHRPLIVLRDGSLPAGDMAVLLGVAAVLWVTAGIVFARRDLSTL